MKRYDPYMEVLSFKEDVEYFQKELKWKSEMNGSDPNFSGVLNDAIIDMIVSSDTYKIVSNARDKDGNVDYNMTEGFFKDDTYGCRAYCLAPNGGICIWCDSDVDPHYEKILTIGEDDENYFLMGRCVWEDMFENKVGFVDCVSRCLSLFNNNVKS